MGSTIDKLNKVKETKAAIKAAIIAKGVEVTDDTIFADYPNKITAIEVSSGESITKEQSDIINAWNQRTKDGTSLDSLYSGYYRTSSGDTVDLDFQYIDFSKVTDIQQMFSDNSIKSITIRNMDTSNVKNMGFVFYKITMLTELDLSSWYTPNAASVHYMFGLCSNLEAINICNFDLTNCYSAPNMFYNCNKLHDLRLDNCSNDTINKIISDSKFPTGFIIDSEGNEIPRKIFCKEAETKGLTVPLGWVFVDAITGTVIEILAPYVPYEFRENGNITEVKTLVNDTHTSLDHMFVNCSNLTTINTQDWDTSNVTDMSFMFNNCYALTSLDLSNWNTSNVTNMGNMFNNCYALTSLDLSNWKTTNVTDMRMMFNNCYALTSLDLSNFDTSKVTDMRMMFNYCSALETLNISNWKTTNVTNMGNMFMSCTSLTSLDLSNWNTSQVTDMGAMFLSCSSLETLDIRNFDMTNVSNTGGMFNSCNNLKELRLDNCSADTINKIITSPGFQTGTIDGQTRKIYCQEANAAGLTAPDGWEFVYVEEGDEE